ncbi:MAG: DUF2807 domain-containing protein [Flavobacteriales bacterium]|nr:DUF2807 domain-containing protein [Flavobacteriales bacterium]
MRFTLGILILLTCLTGCKDRCKRLDGPRERYEQLLLPVHSLALRTPAEVTLYVDTFAHSNLEIFAQPEVYHILKTDVDNLQCVVEMDACFKDQEAVLINATFKRIDSIIFESAGQITSGNLILQDSIRIKNTGLGDIDLTLKSEQVFSHITSSGSIILAGTTNRSVSLASGSGEISAFNLIADTAIIHSIGSSIIQVYADHYLEVHFWNPTTVQYRGEPDSIVVFGEGTLVNANL